MVQDSIVGFFFLLVHQLIDHDDDVRQQQKKRKKKNSKCKQILANCNDLANCNEIANLIFIIINYFIQIDFNKHFFFPSFSNHCFRLNRIKKKYISKIQCNAIIIIPKQHWLALHMKKKLFNESKEISKMVTYTHTHTS